jgi:hypothetical protein
MQIFWKILRYYTTLMRETKPCRKWEDDCCSISKLLGSWDMYVFTTIWQSWWKHCLGTNEWHMVGIGCLQSTKDALLGWTHYQHNESAKGEALGSEREREAEEEIWGGKVGASPFPLFHDVWCEYSCAAEKETWGSIATHGSSTNIRVLVKKVHRVDHDTIVSVEIYYYYKSLDLYNIC